MEEISKDILSAFNGILDNLVDGDTYDSLPPKGPIDLQFSSVSEEELSSLDQDLYGQDEEEKYWDSYINRPDRSCRAFCD